MMGRNSFRRRVRADLHDAGELAKEKLGQLQESAYEYYQEGKRKTREWRQVLESYVQEKPLSSVLIAAGIGVCVGLLLMARRRRRYEEEEEELERQLGEAGRG